MDDKELKLFYYSSVEIRKARFHKFPRRFQLLRCHIVAMASCKEAERGEMPAVFLVAEFKTNCTVLPLWWGGFPNLETNENQSSTNRMTREISLLVEVVSRYCLGVIPVVDQSAVDHGVQHPASPMTSRPWMSMMSSMVMWPITDRASKSVSDWPIGKNWEHSPPFSLQCAEMSTQYSMQVMDRRCYVCMPRVILRTTQGAFEISFSPLVVVPR